MPALNCSLEKLTLSLIFKNWHLTFFRFKPRVSFRGDWKLCKPRFLVQCLSARFRLGIFARSEFQFFWLHHFRSNSHVNYGNFRNCVYFVTLKKTSSLSQVLNKLKFSMKEVLKFWGKHQKRAVNTGWRAWGCRMIRSIILVVAQLIVVVYQ